MMREFTNIYGEHMGELNNIQLVKVLEKYADAHWMLSETYNYIIAALSKSFETFTPKELASICLSFSKAGLQQEDILKNSVERIA
jgi:hypothetical protein